MHSRKLQGSYLYQPSIFLTYFTATLRASGEPNGVGQLESLQGFIDLR